MTDHLMQALKKMRPTEMIYFFDSNASILKQFNCQSPTDVVVFLLTNKNWENITLNDWDISNFIETQMNHRNEQLAEMCIRNRDIFMDMHLERTVAKLWGHSRYLKQFVLTRISKKQDINSLAKLCYYANVEYDELSVEIINELFLKSQHDELISLNTSALWRSFLQTDLSLSICIKLDPDIICNVSIVKQRILDVRISETDGLEELSKIAEFEKILTTLTTAWFILDLYGSF